MDLSTHYQDKNKMPNSLNSHGLTWTNGIGKLPGSELKFRRDENGDLEVVTEDLMSVSDAIMTPLSQDGQALVDDQLNNDDKSLPATETYQQAGKPDVYKAKSAHREELLSYKLQRKSITKNDFTWDEYMADENSIAVPVEVFRKISGNPPLPEVRNPFKQGCYLEAVDPLNQSKFCLVRVAQVCGFRMRLHFEGYAECYDFWVNADSPLIFPCGFCDQTNRKLLPPKDVEPSKFNWETYGSVAKKSALENSFLYMNRSLHKSEFKVHDKLEAVDRHNSDLVCVASVKSVINDYVLVHFDGWEQDFDYWARFNSPYIHPVGWCEANDVLLTPPFGHVDNGDPFSWEKYLSETQQTAADKSCFSSESHGFEEGMKLEAVDRRNPLLVRVGTIIEVTPIRIKVHFDGWSRNFDDWYDVDSHNIHPPTWCDITGHPLQPPVQINRNPLVVSGCPTPGCTGIGHVLSKKFSLHHKKHHSEFGCPYSAKNLSINDLHDRLSSRKRMSRRSLQSTAKVHVKQEVPVGAKRRGRPPLSSTSEFKLLDRQTFFSESPISEKRRSRCHRHRTRRISKENNLSAKMSYLSDLGNVTQRNELPVGWERHTKLLSGVAGLTENHIKTWSIESVADFVSKVTGKTEYMKLFTDDEIDGQALLLLTQNDLTKVLKLKLGPSLKVFNTILMIKAAHSSITPQCREPK